MRAVSKSTQRMIRVAGSSIPVAVFAWLLGSASAVIITQCEESWRCKFEHAYSTGVFTWNLNPLCRAGGGYNYSGPSAEGQIFSFNICGNTSSSCSDYTKDVPEYESHGAAVQFMQPERGMRTNGGCLRPDNTTCTDYTFGGPTCCSLRRCEVVAYNVFVFDPISLVDPNAGITLKYIGYPDRNDDNIACPDQAPGLRRLRTFLLTLLCDPKGALDDITILSYNENSPYCTFRVTAKSRAACGVPDALPVPAAATGVGPGGQFGFVILGSLLGGAAVIFGPSLFARAREYLPGWLSRSSYFSDHKPLPMMAAPSTPLVRR